MCGICGIIGELAHQDTLKRMNNTLIHRGPDGEGYYWGDGASLAMRRLAIIDVGGSEQPLYNEDGMLVLVFNGEIYNFKELRHTLQAKGHIFRTEGDGETILHLYEEYGINAPDYLRGQFAFALWDSVQHRLVLGRDALGEKPLYYCHHPKAQRLLFASEIKAILQHEDVERKTSFSNALTGFLQAGYWQNNLTPFEGIYSVPPAHTLVFEGNHITLNRYFASTIAPSDSTATEADYLPELGRLLLQAVERCMIADVPLGAFLSGGLDSSLIVALMKGFTSTPIQTFSIGFEGDDSFNETHYAEQVAQYLGTQHTPFIVAPHTLDLLPKLIWHLDQPFADSSALPTFLVSQLTRQHVTVALTGDGGDELFAGYERFYAGALVARLGAVPKPIWGIISTLLGVLTEGTGYYNVVKRARRFARGASLPLGDAYAEWMTLFDATAQHDLTGQAVSLAKAPQAQGVHDLLHHNMTDYLPNDLLIKTDRMTMANRLEGRAPFLDRDLVAYANRIPLNLKLKGRTTKHILKQFAQAHLPNEIVHRQKHGFGAPIGTWLKRDSSAVRDTLLSTKARQRGLLQPVAIERLITEHAKGQRDHAQRLWALLTLEVWHQVFMDGHRAIAP